MLTLTSDALLATLQPARFLDRAALDLDSQFNRARLCGGSCAGFRRSERGGYEPVASSPHRFGLRQISFSRRRFLGAMGPDADDQPSDNRTIAASHGRNRQAGSYEDERSDYSEISVFLESSKVFRGGRRRNNNAAASPRSALQQHGITLPLALLGGGGKTTRGGFVGDHRGWCISASAEKIPPPRTHEHKAHRCSGANAPAHHQASGKTKELDRHRSCRGRPSAASACTRPSSNSIRKHMLRCGRHHHRYILGGSGTL